MIRSLFVVLALALSMAENVPEVKPDPMAGLKVNDTSSTWSNFIYCKCGLTCVKQLGSWYVFNMGKTCACAACPGENATVPTVALRGSQGEAPAQKPNDAQKNLKSLELAEADPSEEAAWEAAAVRGSNLLYCRCGKGCAYGRQLGLWTYYCFRYGCKPCPP